MESPFDIACRLVGEQKSIRFDVPMHAGPPLLRAYLYERFDALGFLKSEAKVMRLVIFLRLMMGNNMLESHCRLYD